MFVCMCEDHNLVHYCLPHRADLRLSLHLLLLLSFCCRSMPFSPPAAVGLLLLLLCAFLSTPCCCSPFDAALCLSLHPLLLLSFSCCSMAFSPPAAAALLLLLLYACCPSLQLLLFSFCCWYSLGPHLMYSLLMS